MGNTKTKIPEHIEIHDGSGRFTFVNVTIWQCIKFWLITKLTGGDKPIEK